jgi:hypothetical protein
MPQFADHGKQYLIQNTAPELSVLRLYVEKNSLVAEECLDGYYQGSPRA